MKAFFQKSRNGGFYPHDVDTQKYFKNRIPGTIIVADVKIARNYENHKRFFSFLNTTFDMQEHFTELEAYRYWLVMKCGYFDTIVAPNGNTLFKARSISFPESPPSCPRMKPTGPG